MGLCFRLGRRFLLPAFVTPMMVWGAGFAQAARSEPTSPPPPARFDRESYAERLQLETWLNPEILTERWLNKKAFVRDVYLVAEGPGRNELYATPCHNEDRGVPGPDEASALCPRVYLGKLPLDEARRRLERISGRPVNAYFTVGQVVPRPFAGKFGILEAGDGAWVESGDDTFYVQPDVRVFNLPKDWGTTDRQPVAGLEAPVQPRPPGTVEEARPYFSYEVRLLRDDRGTDVTDGFQPLGRRSILTGQVEFRVRTSTPEWLEIEEVVVTDLDGIDTLGRTQPLCSTSAKPAACVANFGEGIAAQRLAIEITARNADGERLSISRDFTTLDSHPSRSSAAPSAGYRERSLVQGVPPDEVIRLVRVESVESRSDDQRLEYVVDLPPEAFQLSVAGINGAVIKSVTAPGDADARNVPLLIPIFLNVSPYLVERAAGGWSEAFSADDLGVVRTLCDGLQRAVWKGVDAEFMVVDYAATARMYGPFRLHPGGGLTEAQKTHNRGTLAGLAAHLRQPPRADWFEERSGAKITDLSSPLHTLNDLYFRTFPGHVSVLLMTDGSNNPAEPTPRFQPDLWPARLEQLRRPISPERSEAILQLLDQGRSLNDEAVDRFVRSVDEDDGLTPKGLAAYLRAFDPGGTSTLHPHRENRLPSMDALLIPSAFSLPRDMQTVFASMIRENFGGEIYRLYTMRRTSTEALEERLHDRRSSVGALTIDAMIQRVHDQLRASYVIVAEVPNPKQDGAKHPLTFRAVEARETSKGKTKYRPIDGRVRHMPFYTSSKSVRDKLPALAASPFTVLRLLAAHELRNHWNDGDMIELLRRRIEIEDDAVIGQVLRESEIALNLKRLQITAAEVADRDRRSSIIDNALERLRELADAADDLPDPQLARTAVMVAEWYRDARDGTEHP